MTSPIGIDVASPSTLVQASRPSGVSATPEVVVTGAGVGVGVGVAAGADAGNSLGIVLGAGVWLGIAVGTTAVQFWLPTKAAATPRAPTATTAASNVNIRRRAVRSRS